MNPWFKIFFICFNGFGVIWCSDPLIRQWEPLKLTSLSFLHRPHYHWCAIPPLPISCPNLNQTFLLGTLVASSGRWNLENTIWIPEVQSNNLDPLVWILSMLTPITSICNFSMHLMEHYKWLSNYKWVICRMIV